MDHSDANRDALSAWRWVIAKGGLEPNGRDLPLVEMLKDRLDPEAKADHFEDALANSTVTGFVNAFFGVAVPFVSMLRDLLDYFESAEATEGPVNWILVLGDEGQQLEVDLSAFKHWIEGRERASSISRTVPILTTSQLWDLRTSFYPTRTPDPKISPEWDFRQPEPKVKDTELIRWLDAYARGDYLDLPSVVGRILADPGSVGDVAALLTEIYSAIQAIGPNSDVLKRKRSAGADPSDFWSAAGLAQFESDFWIRGRVLDLAAYEQATKAEQALVRDSLTSRFQGLPRRRRRFDINLTDLEEILSLPAWERRYELYSAWILTLILKSLDGHQIELHHDNGRLSFAFRETLMATVTSTIPALEIYSERRVAATQPVGHGRSSGVQPDYSIWKRDTAHCPLAVECKQYARSSTRNFADALNDYAGALRNAHIILANYGPVSSSVLAAVLHDRRARCDALGNVQPDAPEGSTRFRQIVRKVIGEPSLQSNFAKELASLRGKSELLVVDVSGSMSTNLDSPSGHAAILELIRQTGVNRIVTVDETLVAEARGDDGVLVKALSERGSGRTNLGPTVLKLLQTGSAMVILTDDEGLQTLGQIPFREIGAFSIGTSRVHVLFVPQL